MAERKLPMTKTTLSFGLVQVPVGTIKMTDDPKEAKFDTAGPNGKPLHSETRLYNRLTGEELIPPEEVVEAEVVEDEPETPPPGDPIDPEAAQRAFAEAAGTDSPEQKQVLVEDESGVIVEKEDVRRGIRREDGAFTDITLGLAEIDEHTKLDEMKVIAFIDYGQVPRERVLGSYYLGADGPSAAHAMSYLWHAMRQRRRAAVVKWTKRAGQSLGIIVPYVRNGALVVLELAYANRVRLPDERVTAFQQVQPDPVGVESACQLIDAMAATAAESLDEQIDEREKLRMELLQLAADDRQEEFSIEEEPVTAQPDAPVHELLAESSERADEIVEAA